MLFLTRHQILAGVSSILVACLACTGCADDDKDAKQDLGALVDAGAADGEVTRPDGAPDSGQSAVLTMPEGLGLDLSKTAMTQGPIGSVARSVSQAAGISAELDQVVSMFLHPLEVMKIPLGAGHRTHAATVTIGAGAKASQYAVKVDFSDFDADGDGNKDGCSGHTGAVPICIRVWIEGERYLSARLDVLPTQELAGAGRFTAVKIPSLPGGEAGTTVSISYDHRRLDHRLTELYWGAPSEDPQLGKWATIRHLTIEQSGAPAAAQKTINLTDVMPSQPGSTLKYVGRYRDDGSLWFGAVNVTGVFTQLGLLAFGFSCVDLTSGQTVDKTQCESQGVAFTNIAHLPAGTDKELSLPAGFPGSPTF